MYQQLFLIFRAKRYIVRENRVSSAFKELVMTCAMIVLEPVVTCAMIVSELVVTCAMIVSTYVVT